MNPTVKTHNDKIIGYKALKKDNKGFFTDGMGRGKKQYFEVGKTYTVEGEPKLVKMGCTFLGITVLLWVI